MTTFNVTSVADLQLANASAEAGDTIAFRTGTYNIDQTITLKSGVSYIGTPGTVLNSTSSYNVMQGNDVSDVTISGITFNGGPNVTDGAHSPIIVFDSNNIKVTNNIFQNIYADASVMFYQSDNITVSNNIGNNLRQFVSGVGTSGSHANITISGNTVSNVDRIAIEMQGAYSHLHVTDNTITNFGGIAISLVGGTVTTDVLVSGNTISGGITAVEASDADTTVMNNSIFNTVGGVSISNTPHSIFNNNTFTNVSIPLGEDGGYTGLMTVGSNLIDGANVFGWAGHINAAFIDPTLPPAAPPQQALVAGTHTLSLKLSEDAWLGDAQFTISVNGQQVGGVQTATASHAAGQMQSFDVVAGFGASNNVSVNFLNDAHGGTSSTDRNLYINSATIDGVAISSANRSLFGNGVQQLYFAQPATSSTSDAAGPNTIVLKVSEDAWRGDAEFTVQVNGVQVGGIHTVTASHTAGISQDVVLTGNWGTGAEKVGITFINDAYDGTASTDRNLYVNGLTYDGKTAMPGPAALMANGTANFGIAAAGKGSITLLLATDAASGASYSVAIDGKTSVARSSVSALNAKGLTQEMNVPGALSPGWHDIAVSLLRSSANGGAQPDLIIKGIAVNNATALGSSAALSVPQTDHFAILIPG